MKGPDKGTSAPCQICLNGHWLVNIGEVSLEIAYDR